MRVDEKRCTGCGRCVAACHRRLLTLEVSGYRKHAACSDPSRCDRCLKCLAACPVGAVREGGAAGDGVTGPGEKASAGEGPAGTAAKG